MVQTKRNRLVPSIVTARHVHRVLQVSGDATLRDVAGVFPSGGDKSKEVGERQRCESGVIYEGKYTETAKKEKREEGRGEDTANQMTD